MSIRVKCAGCEKAFKLGDQFAGKRIRCPQCQAPLRVPAAGGVPQTGHGEGRSEGQRSGKSPENSTRSSNSDDFVSLLGEGLDADSYALSAAIAPPDEPAPNLPPRTVKKNRPRPDGQAAHDDSWTASRSVTREAPAAIPRTPPTGWRDHLLWVLLAAIVPLGASTFIREPPFAERLEQTILQHPELAQALKNARTDEEFFAALPGNRLAGAHLAHGSYWHWAWAAGSAALFFGLLVCMFPTSGLSHSRLVWTGLITGTVGIVLLLGFQLVAAFTQGFNIHGRGIVVLIFYIVKFIGFSYRSALDPENGFVLSFMGFTCGVGLCEELCKALPVVFFLRRSPYAGWRAACLVGLASGVGFGVSEGISYSSDFYDGIAPVLTYLLRFSSCVALHATWAGAVALLMCQNQDYLGGDGFEWGDAGAFVLYYLLTAMVLHGLYDTLLKKEHEVWALAIAAVSFAWLAWLVRDRRRGETAAAET